MVLKTGFVVRSSAMRRVFQEGPYFLWASDRQLILLDCQGVLPDVIDEFLKAYLVKYPSSLR
jgi:hypothetical protein